MAVSPAFAAPFNPASSLSLSSAPRAAAHSKDKSNVIGTGVIVAILAVAAVGAGIAVVVTNDDSSPDSN